MAAHTCRAKPLQLGLPREAGLKNPPPGVTLLGYRAPAAAAGEQSEAEHRGERGARYGPRLSEMRHRVRDAARAGDKERLCVRARSKTGLKRIAGHAVRERLPSSRVLESGISRHPRRYFFPRKSGQKKKEKRSRDRTPGTENGRVPAARVARARTRTERIGTKDDASLDSAAYLCRCTFAYGRPRSLSAILVWPYTTLPSCGIVSTTCSPLTLPAFRATEEGIHAAFEPSCSRPSLRSSW